MTNVLGYWCLYENQCHQLIPDMEWYMCIIKDKLSLILSASTINRLKFTEILLLKGVYQEVLNLALHFVNVCVSKIFQKIIIRRR